MPDFVQRIARAFLALMAGMYMSALLRKISSADISTIEALGDAAVLLLTFTQAVLPWTTNETPTTPPNKGATK